MSPRRNYIIHVTLLSALCGVLYFPYLGSTPFFDKGEPREAMAVQDILLRGEWLVPLKRATDIPSKPPLFHWSAALASRLSGELNEATIRLPSALYATFGVLVIYALGRRLFGAEVGFLGGAILATTLVYANQALSARVDMTLCFYVTLSLALFYSLYRGFLANPFWYYAFYALMGISTLAKGPLAIVLPGLVAGTFLISKKRWNWIGKFCLHPGVILTLLLSAGWYVVAVSRGGEGFVDRQLLGENIERFFGGSGHSHPIYYYIVYLFTQGAVWSIFLPPLLWNSFKNFSLEKDDLLFLKLWFIVMFVFFSISIGKRPVYLLPLYPAVSLLTAHWFISEDKTSGAPAWFYKFLAVFAGAAGVLLFAVTAGALWSHEPGWFLRHFEELLKAKDQANLAVVGNDLDDFGWPFTAVALLTSCLWFSLARCLWTMKFQQVPSRLVMISVLLTFVGRFLFMPVIAEAKSYRSFMNDVNQRVTPSEGLYLYGRFNSDQVVFYRGKPLQTLALTHAEIASKIGSGDRYVIIDQDSWKQIERHLANPPAPLLVSQGSGPEGDAPLVLINVSLP